MGIISKLICEHPLPIPLGDLTEEEKELFGKIEWDELEFFTSSFFDADEGPFDSSIYTITEDGQFYKNRMEFKVIEENGKQITKEVDKGIERQDFTGEIFFGLEFFEEDYDYAVAFRSLFFKGELKELELEEWDKRDNKKRKEALKELTKYTKKELSRRKSFTYLATLPLRRAVHFVVSIIKWITFKIFELLVKIEMWTAR